MEIDIILPTFNRCEFLQRSIDSVLAQTYQQFNLYIVDDGSTDQTSELLKKYEMNSKVHVLKTQNQGVSAARNFGVLNSNAKWIGFLDSDDEWLPNKLQIQTDYLLLNSRIQFIHTEEIWIRNNIRVNPKLKHSKSSNQIFERSLEFCLISPSTVILTRELFNHYSGFNNNFIVCEDFDLWNKILANHEIGFIERPLINKYAGHPDQLSFKFTAMDYWRIKSLVDLYKSDFTNSNQKKLIIEIIDKKSKLLLKNYLKHENEIHFNEVSLLIKSIGIK